MLEPCAKIKIRAKSLIAKQFPMPIKYACFLSYRHGDGFVERIVTGLRDALRDLLQLRIAAPEDLIFYDRDIKGGTFYNEALASALCESACLVVVYTSVYFRKDRTYCAREYRAMELLERKRLRCLGETMDYRRGLIIPIVFTGWEDLPKVIKDLRQAYNFEQLEPHNRKLGTTQKFAKEIREIADYIAERFNRLNSIPEDHPCMDCNGFALPSEGEILNWLEGIQLPPPRLPFRRTK